MPLLCRHCFAVMPRCFIAGRYMERKTRVRNQNERERKRAKRLCWRRWRMEETNAHKDAKTRKSICRHARDDENYTMSRLLLFMRNARTARARILCRLLLYLFDAATLRCQRFCRHAAATYDAMINVDVHVWWRRWALYLSDVHMIYYFSCYFYLFADIKPSNKRKDVHY